MYFFLVLSLVGGMVHWLCALLFLKAAGTVYMPVVKRESCKSGRSFCHQEKNPLKYCAFIASFQNLRVKSKAFGFKQVIFFHNKRPVKKIR
jgi:hypothetical protein